MTPRIAVLAGPTAVGKTELAIALAERVGAEVISADSQQVYRHFDLGTAKPTAAQRARVPHHLISVVEPTDRMDAARYVREASAAIESIHSRGKHALVVGGTGLYLRALVFGVVEGPGRDEPYRRELEERAQREGRPALHAELAAGDPESGRRIEKQDLVRIIRALELRRLTGRTASELRAEHAFATSRYEVWGRLRSLPRAELYRRIELRAARMFQEGLVDEVRALVSQGFGEAPAMASIGYAEALRVVRGEWTKEQAVRAMAQSSRQYAKRQLTWFRKEPWLVPLEGDDVEAPAAELRAFLGAQPP